MTREQLLRQRAEEYGQDHVFQFWNQWDRSARDQLLNVLETIDYPLMKRLVEQWVITPPPQETFQHIVPVPVIPQEEPGTGSAYEAWEAGEEALRNGRVGLFLVAGGQGTRLGFEGPKGAYPIGPMTGKSLFAYHAEKILHHQRRYGCRLPWYIMVSDTNEAATRAFFQANHYFGLQPADVHFFTQRMVPCVDQAGKFMLEAPGQLAMNPNGHGGCIPALVENGILDNARNQGIDILSYFQVDNWAVKLADPRFIGYHVLHNAEMSSKNHRKNHPREAVGVHCLCDGQYRVIEYSELDLYPQLLETDNDGQVIYYAGNPAMHILSVDFVQRVYNQFDQFPWHLAHKKIPYLDASGNLVKPGKPNGYKFETFVFDALRFIRHAPVALEIGREGEYTPIKQFEGENSVVAARRSMGNMWAKWLKAAGNEIPTDAAGDAAIPIEISPCYAVSLHEFVEKSQQRRWPLDKGLAIDAKGDVDTGAVGIA